MQTKWSPSQSWIDRRIERVVRAVVLNAGKVFYDVRVIGAENLPESGARCSCATT